MHKKSLFTARKLISSAKSILLQFLSFNTKLLIKTFLIQKIDPRKKEINKIFHYLLKFPCSVCGKPVAINHEAVCCDVWNRLVLAVITFVRKHTEVSKKIQFHGSANLVCKISPFF